MQLASTFDQFNTSMQEPAETAIKGFFPVGKISGMGTVSISAMELVIPSKELMFQGIRFEVTPADQYARTGIATIPLGEVEKLLLALENMATARLTTERFTFNEIETKIEDLTITLFNTDRDKVAIAVSAAGSSCHLSSQNYVAELKKYISIAAKHLRTTAAWPT